MARKKKETPLDLAMSEMFGSSEYNEEVTDIDNIDDFSDDVDEIDDDPVEDATEGEEPTGDDNGNAAAADNSDIPQEVLDRMNNNQASANTTEEDSAVEEPADEEITEAQQVGALFDAVGESLGWNMADIDESQRPVTVDDLTKYIADLVVENSVPTYANDQVRALDEYVKNGGRFEDFYQKQQERVSFDNIDMDDESNQKAVVRELLKYNGYSDEQINNKIMRYEDADMLVEESQDALAILKSIREQELAEYTRRQEEAARIQQEESRKFFESVTNQINSLTDIRGIQVPKEDRKKLFDYIFKVDQNGVSQYQKDYNQNLSRNLIESAYFTMNADKFVQSAKKSGETSAADKLRKMLRHNAKNHSAYNVEEKNKSVVELTKGLF